MKKIFTLIIVALFLFAGKGHAANFVVSGSSLSWLNGLYVESGVYNGKPYYTGNTYYGISWSGSSWQLGEGCCGFIDIASCSSLSTSPICPTDGWDCLEITVAAETDNVGYSAFTLRESLSNDGSFTEPVTIRLKRLSVGQNFTGANGDDFAGNKITFGTLPTGLTPHAIKNDTTITLTFTGGATANNHANETYITLQFTDAAFALGMAANVRYSLDSIHLLFREELTVASAGADYTTISAALAAAADDDIISLAGETFTEAGLAVNKTVVIRGQGADQTIVQADVTPNTAADRVFNVTGAIGDTVEFRDLTIRHGKAATGNGQGGGIKAYATAINIYNCIITDNVAYGSGAGIETSWPVKVVASLISNNKLQSPTHNGYGGGIYCYNLSMVNSTVTGNMSIGAVTGVGTPNIGGGLVIFGTASIINSTITGNTAADGGSGIALFNGPAHLFLTNSIVYGNTGGDDVQNYNGVGEFNASNCVIGASSTAIISGTNYNVSTADPLLSALSDNGGTTMTMALGIGSFAIDEGATGDSIPTTDQRGFLANGTRDIGAFEYGGLVTGTKLVPSVDAMAVYPNPTSNFINVTTAEVNSVYTITDLLGQAVLAGKLTAKHSFINISVLTSGVYILKAGDQQYKLLKQ